ncbi:hypothetical protein ebA767 [Aromatoleum aromaticum EbN1]|uniref:Uncharacterized protein n=1 Tax=Aromatoleum aromaticum (strain DSM 19018 / LMG 30748 / EbN1) TaxID=76114 RepID=Q5P844_AROAE|nr:hypothetical protein ebA767 [Aromatoleum aromaticum EbN1]
MTVCDGVSTALRSPAPRLRPRNVDSKHAVKTNPPPWAGSAPSSYVITPMLVPFSHGFLTLVVLPLLASLAADGGIPGSRRAAGC